MIIIQITEGSITKALKYDDVNADRLIAAYQNGANIDINGTSSREQVLDYILKDVINKSSEVVINFEKEEATRHIIIPPIKAEIDK